MMSDLLSQAFARLGVFFFLSLTKNSNYRLKVLDPKSLENEFSLNWQIWSLFLPKHHPW